MRVLFLGTPKFAETVLDRLLKSEHTVVGVVTQPDRAVKRGKVECCPVKTLALAHGLTVIQPQKIRNDVRTLVDFGAEVAVTAAYGQILTQAVLDAFPHGVLNVHASLLPKYRGASPIQTAIADGERITGVTIMRTELGIDTGDILSAAQTEIGDNENCGELTARLAEIGGALLVETLDDLPEIVPIKQNESEATHCSMIKKQEEYLSFRGAARDTVNKIRALAPTPCAKFVLDGETYKIGGATVSESDKVCGSRGEIIRADKRLIIACDSGAIEVTHIQAPSKRMLGAEEFLRGRKLAVGANCGS